MTSQIFQTADLLESIRVNPQFATQDAPSALWSTPTLNSITGSILSLFDNGYYNSTNGIWDRIKDGFFADDFVLLSAQEGSQTKLLYAQRSQFVGDRIPVPVFNQGSCPSFDRATLEGDPRLNDALISAAAKFTSSGDEKVVAVIDTEEGWVALSFSSQPPYGSHTS